MPVGHAVYWSEGLFLSPYHLQFQDYRIFQNLRGLGERLNPLACGVRQIEYSARALREGKFRLESLDVVMPDGTELRLGHDGSTVEAVDLEPGLDANKSGVTVWIMLPVYSYGRGNVRIGAAGEEKTRYQKGETPFVDFNEGAETATVEVLLARPELKADALPSPDWEMLPLFRFRREGGKGSVIAPDPLFFPPAVQVRESPRLLNLLRDLRDLIVNKSRAISDRVPDFFRGEQSLGGLLALQRLSIINRAHVALNHVLEPGFDHPRTAYRQLAEFCAELAAHGPKRLPPALEIYDHRDPGRCFNKVCEEIERLLKFIVPTGCREIPMDRQQSKTRNCFVCSHECAVEDEFCPSCNERLYDDQNNDLAFGDAYDLFVGKTVRQKDLDSNNYFIFEVRSRLTPAAVRSMADTGRIRLGSLSDVRNELHPRALPGVPMEPLDQGIPAEIRSAPGATYFQLRIRDLDGTMNSRWTKISPDDPPTVDVAEQEPFEGFTLYIIDRSGKPPAGEEE